MAPMSLHPFLVFVIALGTLLVSAWIGWSVLRKKYELDEAVRTDFGIVLTAALTLLGLIISFTFSIATGRYDQRRNYEEAEANAIGTEYVRADLVPPADAAKMRTLLQSYLQERLQFYVTSDEEQLLGINARTARLQSELWAAVAAVAAKDSSPVMALVVSGMNDVLNSQGYTQAAWWYKIPGAAWLLMLSIAIGCNLLVGFGARGGPHAHRLLPILPLITAIAFLLIADIDTPRRGLIRVRPLNLIALADSLAPR
jgi:hypothetical protein